MIAAGACARRRQAYSATMTDADGPVDDRQGRRRLSLPLPDEENLAVEQWLIPLDDGDRPKAHQGAQVRA